MAICLESHTAIEPAVLARTDWVGSEIFHGSAEKFLWENLWECSAITPGYSVLVWQRFLFGNRISIQSCTVRRIFARWLELFNVLNQSKHLNESAWAIPQQFCHDSHIQWLDTSYLYNQKYNIWLLDWDRKILSQLFYVKVPHWKLTRG